MRNFSILLIFHLSTLLVFPYVSKSQKKVININVCGACLFEHRTNFSIVRTTKNNETIVYSRKITFLLAGESKTFYVFPNGNVCK